MPVFNSYRRDFVGNYDRFLQFGGSVMRREKRREGFGYSWRAAVILLLLASLIVAAASVYMADCLFERALTWEYSQYIQLQKQSIDGCELKFNDGIYQENIRLV